MQDSVVESQIKRDLARKAESEKLSNAKSGSRIFGEDEKERSKFFWKEVAADSIERLRIADEARDLTAKATERLARLEMAEEKKREFRAMTESYEKEKSRLLEIQQALGQRFRDYQRKEAEQSDERGAAAKRLASRTISSSMLFEACVLFS